MASKLRKMDMARVLIRQLCRREDYLKFQREARTDLRKQAAAAGYKLFKFNKNHYCFSAVLQDEETGTLVYVSVSDVRFSSSWYNQVLYHTMEYEKDWTGGPNRFCQRDGITEALSGMKKIRRAS